MPVQKEAVKRFVGLVLCTLGACSLELPSSGPALTGDGADPIHEIDPITATPGAPPVSNPSGVGTATGASTPGLVAPMATNPGVGVVVDDAGTTIVTAPPSAAADAGTKSGPVMPPEPPASLAFTLASSAFDDGARLPTAFTCRAADQSPPLSWTNPPANTKTFSLVMTAKEASKPNATATVEWVVWGIPVTRSMLPPGVAAGSQPSNVPGTHQDASSETGSGVSGFTGAGGYTGFGVGAGVVSGSFGGSWGAGAGGSVAAVGAGGAPYYPVDSSGTPPRYHGPCGTAAVTYEFTLFALDANATMQWGSFVSIETVTQWIKTRSNVLGQASLSTTFP
jgi:phosphatidylethanolamine-binding protein (PEBP) family uncharacterized protein